jgi:hypothetical protein
MSAPVKYLVYYIPVYCIVTLIGCAAKLLEEDEPMYRTVIGAELGLRSTTRQHPGGRAAAGGHGGHGRHAARWGRVRGLCYAG